MLRTYPIHCGTLMLLAAAWPVGAAAADVEKLLDRIPGEANAIVVIDVERIMKSPLAVREHWNDKRAAAYAERPLVVPPDAARVVMAALIEPVSMRSLWEVSVMELTKNASLDAIARAESGYLDKFGDVPAVWSPINAYFVQLEPSVIGAVCPANRQFAARWARQKHTLGGALASSYLKTAAMGLDSGPEVVIAIDLEEVTSPQKLKRRIAAGAFKSLAGKTAEADALCQALASMKGLTLNVEIKNEATGKGVINFGRDVSILSDVAKPLLLEVLGNCGVSIDDVKKWMVVTRGDRVTFEGKLSADGLRRIFSLVEPPAPLDDSGEAPVTPDAKTPGATGKAQMAAASQKYYQSVAKILDNLRKSAGTGSESAALSQIAGWMKRDVRRINRLPILNVDPDLLQYGALVSGRLSEAGQVLGLGSMRTRARSEVGTVTYFGDERSDNDPYGNESPNRQIAVEHQNLSAQRRQAAMEEKAKSAEEAFQIIKDLDLETVRIRTEMTQRYGVEF